MESNQTQKPCPSISSADNQLIPSSLASLWTSVLPSDSVNSTAETFCDFFRQNVYSWAYYCPFFLFTTIFLITLLFGLLVYIYAKLFCRRSSVDLTAGSVHYTVKQNGGESAEVKFRWSTRQRASLEAEEKKKQRKALQLKLRVHTDKYAVSVINLLQVIRQEEAYLAFLKSKYGQDIISPPMAPESPESVPSPSISTSTVMTASTSSCQNYPMQLYMPSRPPSSSPSSDEDEIV